MVPTMTRLAFIFGVLLYFALFLYLLRKRTLSVKFAILWFLLGAVMLLLAVFPSVLTAAAALMGFEVASNALFSVLLFFMLMILLSLSSGVSRQQKQIKELAQKLALFEKELRDSTER